jgi:hypothetical protein
MTDMLDSIRRRTLVVGLAVASFAGVSGALASFEDGSDYAAPRSCSSASGRAAPRPPESSGRRRRRVPAAPTVWPRSSSWATAPEALRHPHVRDSLQVRRRTAPRVCGRRRAGLRALSSQARE